MNSNAMSGPVSDIIQDYNFNKKKINNKKSTENYKEISGMCYLKLFVVMIATITFF